jgi:hypothetical protein
MLGEIIMLNHMPGLIRKGGLLPALIAAIFTPQAFAVPAGRVDFSVGKVLATGADGVTRDLMKGAEINAGDSIATGDGRIHIRFTDGAYMSLQPNTSFKVETYTFNGKADGQEKGVFNLVKGGLRTISGFIGKGKRENYELRTKTATIGIRGTAYSANQTDDTLTVSVGQGLIAVTNEGGSLTIGAGQSAIVHSSKLSPEMTDQKALEPKSEKQQDALPTDQVAAAGEQRAHGGGLKDLTTVTPMSSFLTTGSGFAVSYAASNLSFVGVSVQSTTGNTATFDANGILKDFTAGGNFIDFATGGTAIAPPETGSDALIGWGRWVGAIGGNISGGSSTYVGSEGIHYVAGLPSTLASLNLGSNAMVDYTMFGNTLPSVYFSGSTSQGNVSGISVFPAKATVTFSATPTISLGFTVATSITTYTMTNFGAGAIPLAMGGAATFTGSGTTSVGCITACTVSLSGLFTGTSAERLGIAYFINDGSTNSQVKGAAVFKTP